MKIVLLLSSIACFSEAVYLRNPRKLGSSSSTSREEGQPMRLRLAVDGNKELGLVPLNANITADAQTRKACIDEENGYEFLYGDDYHLRPVGMDCYLELNEKRDRIECDENYERRDEDQIWLFFKTFNEDDEDFILMGFDRGKARVIQYDDDAEYGIKLVKPKDAGRRSAQYFNIDDDFFEESSSSTTSNSRRD